MKTFTTLIVFSLMLMAVTNCKNDDDTPSNPIDKLPPATQTGENTFGCLVNGKPFVVSNTTNMTAIYQGGGLSIAGEIDVNNFFSEVSIFISESIIGQQIAENITYTLNNDNTMKGQYYREDKNCFYYTTLSEKGFVEIKKLDKVNFIVSGTFGFQAISDDCKEIISITNGRFDLQYIP
ncbi:DUF6252 family protein [Mariniflexile sp.]|uniref:DUF6252 family protein n=1 Tax=Mariniflexile sp. TaxID=1979402 RepID=UPI0040478039